MKMDAAGGARVGGHALLALLTFTNMLNFVDRNLLSSFANFLKPELHLTDFQFGLLTGLVFLIFYSFAGLLVGMLADLTSRPRLIGVAIGLWSLLTAASGAARGFVSLAVPRALIGVGESALAPSAMSLLADSIDRARMGLAAGIYYMGVPLGAGAGLLVAGYLGPAIGWRNCFYVLGIFGTAVASIYFFIREPRPARAPGPGRGFALAEQVRLLVGALRRSPGLTATIAGGTALHLAVGSAQFDQLWYVSERGFERGEIARLSGYVTVVAGVAGNLFGGYLGDWWHRHRTSGRPMVLAAMMLVTLPLSVGFRLMAPGSPLFVAGMGLQIFQLSAFYGPTFSTVQDLAPPGARATVTAFYAFCLNVIGMGLGITGSGWAIDHFRAAGMDQPYTCSALFFIGASALAIPCFFAAGTWSKRDRARIDATLVEAAQ